MVFTNKNSLDSCNRYHFNLKKRYELEKET